MEVLKQNKTFGVSIVEGEYKSYSETAGFEFDTIYKISDPEEDRVRDDVDPLGMDASEYHHQSSKSISGPVLLEHSWGKSMVAKSYVWSDSNGVYAGVKFADFIEEHKEAKIVAELVKNDFPVKASIGFTTQDYEPKKDGGIRIKKWKMLEWSFVNVPAHPKTGKIKSMDGDKTIEISIEEYNKLKAFKEANKPVLKQYRNWLKSFRELQEFDVLEDELKSVNQVFEGLELLVKNIKPAENQKGTENQDVELVIDPESEIGKKYLKNLEEIKNRK